MKARWYRMKHKKGLSHPEISLTPLIDTAWVLLVIFMVTGPIIKKEGGLQIELPKGNLDEVAAAATNDIVVWLDAKGALSVNEKQMGACDAQNMKKVLQELKRVIGKTTDRTVFVKGDTGASYGMIVELVEQIKHVGGVKYVALATSKTA